MPVWAQEWHDAWSRARMLACEDGCRDVHTGYVLLAILMSESPPLELQSLFEKTSHSEPMRELRRPGGVDVRPAWRRFLVKWYSSDYDEAAKAEFETVKSEVLEGREMLPAGLRSLAHICLQPDTVASRTLKAAGIDVDPVRAALRRALVGDGR